MGVLRQHGDRIFGDRYIQSFGRQHLGVLPNERMFGFGQDADKVVFREVAQLDPNGESPWSSGIKSDGLLT